MTMYRTDTEVARQVETQANWGLRGSPFGSDLTSRVLSKDAFFDVVIITGGTAEQIPPTEAGGYGTDEEVRAAIALQSHLAMGKQVSSVWKRIPASKHEHVQLSSEPDD